LIGDFRGFVEDSRHLFVKSTRHVVHLRGSKFGHEGRGQVVRDAHTILVDRLDEQAQRDVKTGPSHVSRHLDRDERVAEDVRGRPAGPANQRRDDGAVVELLKQREVERPT